MHNLEIDLIGSPLVTPKQYLPFPLSAAPAHLQARLKHLGQRYAEVRAAMDAGDQRLASRRHGALWRKIHESERAVTLLLSYGGSYGAMDLTKKVPYAAPTASDVADLKALFAAVMRHFLDDLPQLLSVVQHFLPQGDANRLTPAQCERLAALVLAPSGDGLFSHFDRSQPLTGAIQIQYCGVAVEEFLSSIGESARSYWVGVLHTSLYDIALFRAHTASAGLSVFAVPMPDLATSEDGCVRLVISRQTLSAEDAFDLTAQQAAPSAFHATASTLH